MSETLTPALLLEHLPAVGRSLRLFPDYDEPFLEWLFAELHNNRTWGTPVRRLVRDRNGRALGWYVYFLFEDGPCQVLQVAARDRHVGEVLDDLFAHAVGMAGPRCRAGWSPGCSPSWLTGEACSATARGP